MIGHPQRVAGGFEPLLDASLRLGVALERQVPRRIQVDRPLGLVGMLEERQRAAVGEGEKGVDVLAHRAARHRRPLRPGGDERQTQNVLVEVSGRFRVTRHPRRVVQPARPLDAGLDCRSRRCLHSDRHRSFLLTGIL